MKDVFLSYRRKDAGTEGFLLFKDLTKDGYAVFFDHKSLGSGDFRENIEMYIKEADNFIVLLSKSSFDEKINNEDDVYRNEIRLALKHKKRIIGIMLESFPGFPENLPDDIAAIRNINCLKLYIGYYEAMYNRLTSGAFLPSPSVDSEQQAPSDEAINNSIPKELQQLAAMPADLKIQQTQLLLQIMKSFNDSEMCMRFYRYIDLFDRNRGIKDIPDYDGNIPTDLVTYLSFFETLYIIIGSKTIDLSVIDFAYRFRFFAGCNIPVMQKSELLPLGYQYPNIMSFYNIWCDYIVENYDHNVKCDSISEQIPLYENDLHKQYAAYTFAMKMGTPMKIRFLNRYLTWLNLTMKMLDEEDYDDCMALQQEMLNNIANNDERNIFEALTENEMRKSLRNEYCVGLYNGDKLVAQMNLLVNPDEKENLMLDLESELKNSDCAVLDYVVVHPELRGYSIQKTLLFVAECIAKNNNKQGICAVTSPENIYSIKNFLSQEYQIVETKPKYHSIRHYLLKSM
ncbi:MAG: toll/interleukin-1 receptor domain-containing protein [Clostridia bacterium]|nr:toll/interleukin-1 receptor domain-containing protein [Clostridia bacterium]